MNDIQTIADLKPDRKNARKHNERNIGMITRSLQEVGAARSIVVDEEGTILAGHGVVEAAADTGIERVQVVDADGETIVAVRRKGLTAEQKTKLALYDNRTAELAGWDVDILQNLGDVIPLGDFWTEIEQEALWATLPVFDFASEDRNLRVAPSSMVSVVSFGPFAACVDINLVTRARENIERRFGSDAEIALAALCEELCVSG